MKKIIFTGGPGGGKTTALDLIRRELGDQTVIVPEAATILFSGGFPRVKEKEASKSTQRAIYHVQKNMEEVYHSIYPDRILLCDRGTLDGAGYWPDGESQFYDEISSSKKEELSRYDAVIFFESAAVGNISIEGGNPIRNESIEVAVQLDKKVRDIWSCHPQFIHIPHQESFMKKLNNAMVEVKKLIELFSSTKIK